MALQLSIDSQQIDDAQEALLRLYGQFEWVAARAMTNAAKASKAAIAREILPMIEGGPTAWTKRGLIATYASPRKLQVFVGFQHGGGSGVDLGAFSPKGRGVPAGRYMELNAAGGVRRPKSTERRLQRAGVLRDGRYITPAGGVKLDSRGNVRPGVYTQVLTRLRAMDAEGSSQDAPRGPGSRGRSRAKRREVDYFVLRGFSRRPTRWEPGADPQAIARRVGPGPKGGTGKGSGRPGRPQTVGYQRGYERAFHVVRAPRYGAQFPIAQVATRGFNAAFPEAWRVAYEAELAQQRRRGRL